MNELETIIWKGSHRIIPGYGVARRGKELHVPRSMALSYVEQGLATSKRNHAKKEIK